MAVVEVVKYNGSPDVFAWKYPSEELGTWTQLIVNESQEAILFKDGKALDVFQSGRYTLETANIPLLNNIINLPFGGRSPFAAEIWYINKVSSLDIKWGTASPIQLQDPKYSIFVPVRAFGQFGISIEDSKKFLVKLVGNLSQFDKTNIVKYFRGLYLTKAKDTISSYLINKQISILEVNAYLEEISKYIKEKMEPVLEEYGIRLINFYVNDISVPEDDSAVTKLKAALAKKAEMNIIGYNYQQERSFDTLEKAAENPGASGDFIGTGLGLGMGVAMGGTVSKEFGSIAKNINSNAEETKPCNSCGALMPKDKRYCPDCGNDTLPISNELKKENNTVKCSNCGFEYNNTVKFCPQCGNRYNPCPNCGADRPEEDKKCSDCGYEEPDSCPYCGSPLPLKKQAKFCPECGKSLAKSCPNCNTQIVGTPKFCPECGTKLN